MRTRNALQHKAMTRLDYRRSHSRIPGTSPKYGPGEGTQWQANGNVQHIESKNAIVGSGPSLWKCGWMYFGTSSIGS